MPRKRIVLTAALLIIVCLARVPSTHAEEPIALQYYITDTTGVVGPSDVASIENLIIAIENQTSAQFAVYVVNTTGTTPIEQFAVRTFELSELGQKGVDNGLLLVVAVGDRDWKIEVGYGLEGVLNDAKVGNIGRTYLNPAFESGDYGQGIYDAVYAMGNEVLNSDAAQPASYPIPGIPLSWWQLVIAAVVFVVLIVLTRGAIFLWIGGVFRRGGGGKSGGGGAGGKW